MKPKTIIAILLITLGITGFACQGITCKTIEKVFDLSPIQVRSEMTKMVLIQLPLIVGAVALLGGIVFLVMYCWSREEERANQKQHISTTRDFL